MRHFKYFVFSVLTVSTTSGITGVGPLPQCEYWQQSRGNNSQKENKKKHQTAKIIKKKLQKINSVKRQTIKQAKEIMIGKLFYFCIARGETILTDYTKNEGNFRTRMPEILPHVTPNRREQLNLSNLKFFVDASDKLVFVALTSQDYPQRVAFDSLNKIKQEFTMKFSSQQINNAVAQSFDRFYSNELQKHYDFYNSSKCDNLLTLRENVDSLKDVVEQDLQKLLQRGESIDIIVKRTESMKDVSTVLYKNAKGVHRHMWWQNKKITLAIILAVAIAIWLLTSFICGFDYSKC